MIIFGRAEITTSVLYGQLGSKLAGRDVSREQIICIAQLEPDVFSAGCRGFKLRLERPIEFVDDARSCRSSGILLAMLRLQDTTRVLR